jgi:sec1 family domain-containing protein 1
MLNLNTKSEVIPASSENSIVPLANNEPVWKVLIFDEFGRDIISSVLKVNDLRENGVTVHMYVHLI